MEDLIPVDHQETMARSQQFETYSRMGKKLFEEAENMTELSSRDSGILYKMSWKFFARAEKLRFGPEEDDR